MFLPLGYLSQYIFGSLLFLLSLFIIGIILLQRGKGGGLTGALGGLGGQSAFGVKAGDLFTRITAVAVLIWIFVCALACRWYLPEKLDIEADLGSSSMSSPSGSEAEIPGFDLSKETVPGLPSSPVPEVPPLQNLPPKNPSSVADTPATESPKPEASPPTTPTASDPPTVPAPSEKQP